jgi:hypothetical protein
VVPITEELLAQMASPESWGASLAVIVLAVASALLTRQRVAGAVSRATSATPAIER